MRCDQCACVAPLTSTECGDLCQACARQQAGEDNYVPCGVCGTRFPFGSDPLSLPVHACVPYPTAQEQDALSSLEVRNDTTVLAHLDDLGVIDGMVSGPETIRMEVRTGDGLWERVWSIVEVGGGYLVETGNAMWWRVALGDLRVTETGEQS